MPVGKYFYNLPDTGGKEKEGDKESSATEGEGSEEELTTTSGIIPFFLWSVRVLRSFLSKCLLSTEILHFILFNKFYLASDH